MWSITTSNMQKIQDYEVLSYKWIIYFILRPQRMRDHHRRGGRKIAIATGSRCLWWNSIYKTWLQSCTWTQSSDDCKHRTHRRSRQLKSNMDGGGLMKSTPIWGAIGRWWLTEERASVFLVDTGVLERLLMLLEITLDFQSPY